VKENFEKSLLFVLKDEGKFSDIKNDRGGPTNQGITLKTLQAFYKDQNYGDLDQDGDVDINDIKLLDQPDEAAPIYRKYFWEKVKGDKLPGGVDYIVFDSAVNHGPKNAGIFLQRASNQQKGSLITDGVIGPHTLNVVQSNNISQLIIDILKERESFYRKIVKNDLGQQKFFKGWMNRLDHLLANSREFI